MAVATRDRAAVLDYIDRLCRDVGEASRFSLTASTEGEFRETGFQARLDQLAGSRDVDEEELKSLESTVRTALRPVLRFDDDRLRLDDEQAEPWAATVAAHAAALERASEAVGHIQLKGHPSITWVGSGFHVGQGLLVTTRHVAAIFGEMGSRALLRPGLEATIQFSSPSQQAPFPITEILLIHPDLDIAVLRAEGIEGVLPLVFDGTEQIGADRQVAVIGHGSADVAGGGADPLLAAPAAKRLSLGRIIGYEHAVILGEKQWCLAHDCSTEPGFAGGPLVDLVSGKVLGVHFASQAAAPGLLVGGGFAVPASELARDAPIRSLGLSFTSASPEPDMVSTALEEASGAEAAATALSAAEQEPAELVVNRIDAALKERFTKRGKLNTDALVRFIESFGVDYERAVAAQPGRGRVEPEVYCHALVVALQRRGLITAEVEEALGFRAEAEAPFGRAGGEPDEGRGEAARQLKDEYSLADMPREEQLTLLVGTPYWAKFKGDADEPPPLAELVDRLGEDPSDDARAALAWLRERLESTSPVSGEDSGIRLFMPTPWEMVDIAYFSEGLKAARSVGRLTTSLKSGSSCWLIAPDLVVAPAHVVGVVKSRRGAIALAATARSGDLSDIELVVEFEDDSGKSRRAGVKEVAFIDNGLDIMIVRLKRRHANRPPLQIRTDLADHGPVAAIHHAHLQRKMVSAHGGRLIANDGHEVKYVLATAPGVAGAPVFDAHWQVIATHRARLPMRIGAGTPIEGKLGTSVAAMVQHIRNAPNLARLWREIAGSQRALRSIDASLQSTGSGPSQRILIELIDNDTRLDKIPGLRLLSRLGRVVTGVATPRAVGRLAEQQGVVSVEASRSGTALECVHSMPYIRVDQVRQNWEETGDGALIAVIDNGIDVHHDAFLDEAGHTRILAFWDQQDRRTAPDRPSATMSEEATAFVARHGLHGGTLYLGPDIEAIRAGTLAAPQGFPTPAAMAHGTVVCSIAAGRRTGDAVEDFAGGVAPGADLVVIRYDLADASVGYSVGHVSALSFIDRLADDLGKPVVVNISNGMNGGAHDGKAKVEIACGTFSNQGQKPGRVVVKSAGNERQRNRHAELTVPTGARKRLRFFYNAQQPRSEGRRGLEQIQVWMPFDNRYEFTLVPPSGAATPPLQRDAPPFDEFLPNGNRVKAAYSGMEGENGRSLLQLDLSPGQAADIEPGQWRLDIKGMAVARPDLPLHAWIELNSTRSIQFIDSTEEKNTITVPGTSEHVITVGAVEVGEGLVSYDHSSMGPTLSNLTKPEIVAPGVAIVGAGAGRQGLADPRARDGTSLAAPHVAGSIALVLSAWAKAVPKPMPNMIQIRQHLISSSADFNPIGDSQLGHGRLDAEAFYKAAKP